MSTEMETAATIIGAEIRRLWVAERVPIAKIARRLDLDRKTVRRCVRDTAWQPYRRAARPETLLTAHAEYLRERAEQVDYSAQILFQELRQRGYQGSYETVKLFVRPPAGAAFGRRAGADPVRDAARTAEPEVNGTRVLSSATSFKTAGCRVAAPRECLGVQATGRSATPARRLWRTPSL